MDIPNLLEEAKQRQRELVDQINLLEQRKQQLLQEALKMEGEIRILQRLDGQKEGDVVKQKQGEKTDA